MGTRLLTVLIALFVTGCLFETPERLEANGDLVALVDAGADATLDVEEPDTDEDVAEDATEDAVDAPDVTEPETFSFSCDPACSEAEFCGPDSTCFRGAPACTATNQTCDPATAALTEELVCEPVYDGSIGYCRRRCEDGTQCADGESCGAIQPDSEIRICRRTCEAAGDCLGLDVCTASRFGFCRAGCVPFYEGQCTEDTQCFPIAGDAGFCDRRGTVGLNDECNVNEGRSCAEGLLCLTTSAGNRCLAACNPEQTEPDAPGGCAGDRYVCGQLQDRSYGICAQTCDIFDPERQCDVPGQGCTFQGGTAGICFHRGGVLEGRACNGHQDCAGNLACVDSECRPLCLRTAGPGEDGACEEGLRCRTLSGPSLGYCIE